MNTINIRIGKTPDNKSPHFRGPINTRYIRTEICPECIKRSLRLNQSLWAASCKRTHSCGAVIDAMSYYSGD